MINVYIVVEGHSEEKFVKEVLTPYFSKKDIFLTAERVITGKDKIGNACKGGGNSYKLYKNHLEKRIKQFGGQDNYYFSTMTDFYALPNDFPKLSKNKQTDIYKSISYLEDSFKSDIGYKNFIPYIQLHEFETLLYCDIDIFGDEFFDLEISNLSDKIKDDIKEFDNLELINNSKITAPSKRLDKCTNGAYCGRKTTSGINILKKIDISILRDKCKHFDEWISKIEGLK